MNMDSEDSDLSSTDMELSQISNTSDSTHNSLALFGIDMLSGDEEDTYEIDSFIVEEDSIEFLSDNELSQVWETDMENDEPQMEDMFDEGVAEIIAVSPVESLNQDAPLNNASLNVNAAEDPPDQNKETEALNVSTQSEDDGNTCTICFEPWANSSKHRLVSLKCGHLFGFDCIDKWLRGSGSKCPQCNFPSKRSDIRQIFARRLKAIDTSDRDRALQQLDTEKELRKKLEMEHAQSKIHLRIMCQENERLKKDLIEIRGLMKDFQQTRKFVADQSFQEGYVDLMYQLEKTIEISKTAGCRVLDCCELLGMLLVSQQSNNPLFPGYGVKKICTTDLKPSEFVPIHNKAIKDVAFCPNDALILTASLDKTVKLTNMTNNCIVQSFDLKSDVWSCCWNTQSTNKFYVGLQSGTVVEYDIRTPNLPVTILPNSGFSSPVIGIKFVQRSNKQGNYTNGILSCQLSSCTFYESQGTEYINHLVPIEGKFTSLSYEPTTNHFLITSRPTSKQSTVNHMLCEINNDSPLSTNIIQVFSGGSSQVQMSRSKLFPSPSNPSNLLICSGDETNQSALIWDAGKCKRIGNLPSHSHILDVLPFQAQRSSFLSTLTSTHLNIYKWKVNYKYK